MTHPGFKLLCALPLLTPLASHAAIEWLADANGCKLENTRTYPLQAVTWTGDCRDGFATGVGRMEFSVDGVLISAYEGEMKAGRLAGRGVLTTPYGRRYDGQFVDGRYDGNGLLSYPLGTVYRGQFVAGRGEGACSIAWPQGHHYQGQCKATMADGQGELQLANGDRYVGAFALGQPAGTGRYTWANGDVHEGAFHNGERHGPGDYRPIEGVRYTGQFEYGVAEVAGQSRHPDGFSYQGPFHGGSPVLSGSYLNADGSKATASQTLLERLTPRYQTVSKAPSPRSYTAAAEICAKRRHPEVPKGSWDGARRYRAFIVIRNGQVTRLDITTSTPIHETLHPQFVASIERAVRAYDCPGDHVLEQAFTFAYE